MVFFFFVFNPKFYVKNNNLISNIIIINLELKKFDMKNIKFDPNAASGPVIVLIGRRDTGKSFLVRDLLYFHQDIPIGTVISGTEAGNGFYGKLVPKLFIHDEYNSAIVENILKTC